MPGLLTALEAYPWGCTEQIVSRAMPLLYFAETARALGIGAGRQVGRADRRGDPRRAGQPDRLRAASACGRAEPRRQLARRLCDRLPVAGPARSGHAVPDRAFEAALANLGNLVNAYGDFENGGEDLAYALMVLAREGRASIGDLRYYADTRGGGLRDAARAGPARRSRWRSPATSRGRTRCSGWPRPGAAAGEPEQLWRADFGSGLRDAAGVLALAAEAGSAAVDAGGAGRRSSPRPGAVRSPQESLWSLLAAHALDRRGAGRGDRWSTTRRSAGRRCALDAADGRRRRRCA